MWELFDSLSEASSDATTSYCFVCGSDLLVTNDSEGVMVCSSCGSINHYLMDKKSDISSAMADGTNINVYLPKSSLGTSIAGSTRMKLKIVNEWWKWVYKEKSFYDDKRDIEDRCHRGNLTQAVIDNSLNLYKRFSELKHTDGKYVIIRGTNRRAIMAASVYYGARLQRQPRCPKEIADLFDLEVGQMTKGCKRFSQMINLNDLQKDNPRNEAYDYVYSLCHRLNMSPAFRTKATDIIQNIIKLQLSTNHQPPAVAASTLLLTKEILDEGGIRRFRTQLSGIFKVSDVTIQKTFKELKPFIRILSDNDLADVYHQEVLKTLDDLKES